ncbi:MAG: mechanosensitive ion channel [Trichodesmium sp. MO_231.B1]|nr:mechanosensitive ion channel [Trichodesmium sp. MO_231.B1]
MNVSIEQRYSLNAFYNSTLFWTQWLVWLLGIGYISSLFYWSRSWSNWMVGVTIRGSRAEQVIFGWAPLDWILSFGREASLGTPLFIDGQDGLVESITLRVTKLRNLDGELITIPNGSIGVVRNLSSEWSQVNYAIEVAYDADVDRVMGVMEAIAKQLYCDPQWQEQILEAPKVLGIDKIAHTGIVIRLIIKTQPMQQWLVAREFRRRLKKAFDEQGIEVGVPQQVMYVNGPFAKTNNGNFQIISCPDEQL